MLASLFCSHVNWLLSWVLTGFPARTCSAPLATGRRSPAQREVCARRPGQPRYPAALVHTHLQQINASCTLIAAGPFITFLTASVQPQNRAPERRRKKKKKKKKRRTTASSSHRSIFALSWKKNIHTDAQTNRVARKKKAVEERKPYLSTHRCPRVEVVGYTQHPQHRKTQQYPRFPPHGCLVSSSARLVSWLGSARLGFCSGCGGSSRSAGVCAGRFAVRLRQASSVGQGERREQEAASQHQRG